MPRVFNGPLFSLHQISRLTRSVSRNFAGGSMRLGTCQIHQHTRVLLNHDWKNSLCHQRVTCHVDIKDFAPKVRLQLVQGDKTLNRLNRCVVHQHINAAPHARKLTDGLLNLSGIGDIAMPIKNLVRKFWRQVVGNVKDRDLGSGCKKPFCNCSTNATRAAGDHNNSSRVVKLDIPCRTTRTHVSISFAEIFTIRSSHRTRSSASHRMTSG